MEHGWVGMLNATRGNSCIIVPWQFLTLGASRHLTALCWLGWDV